MRPFAQFSLVMELPRATLKDRILLFLHGRRAYRVAGESMLPTLRSGDIVLTDPHAAFDVGDIVVADHPYQRSVKLIKRIASVNADGRYRLVGDNPEASSDSKSFGSIGRREIKGKVVCRVEDRSVNEFLAHQP